MGDFLLVNGFGSTAKNHFFSAEELDTCRHLGDKCTMRTNQALHTLMARHYTEGYGIDKESVANECTII